MENKLTYAGVEIYGFYILHMNGTVSDNDGKFYKSIEEASFYCGLGDKILPKYKD